MSLSAAPRSRRPADGGSSGKRGRPESLVRQFWEDVDTPGVGPKCMFCDHRSQTRIFRAPPATRHTLICKSAPEHVKERLRRLTNNKYSRRPPPPPDATSPPSAVAAAAAALSVAPPQHHVQSVSQQPQHVQTVSQQLDHTPPPQHPHTPVSHQPPPPPPPHHAFDFKAHAPPDHTAHDAALPTIASPRHIVSNITAQHTLPNTGAMDNSVVPMRSALLSERARAPHVALPNAATDLLYSTAANHRIMDDMSASLAHAHAALSAAVIEALFCDGRKKDGAVPTPAEFRLALRDVKEQARLKSKKQRDEARAKCARLENALASLVSAGSVRQVEVDSDDSEEELENEAQLNAKRDWSMAYERK
eukprot:TRINITY_DN4107_c0_g1_i1.p1 TRINITY_DN4107_c0_g1~~TRINITY_DN4107_c0_g1_i1.p1  ORF type:complete len:362 (-),score=107.13 TRINITY_DN4107_c0_g1_i1:951-2036(-)